MRLIKLLLCVCLQATVLPVLASSLKTTDGQTISWNSLRGKWVLINYWASWCDSCVYEIPELNRFFKSHSKEQVALFAVNYDSPSLQELKTLNQQFKINYPSLVNDPSQELGLGDITAVPVTFVFNPQGQLVKRLYGGQSLRSLNKALN